ncbi:MAG: Bug family tripartite tricarboxylate transporter substrate binding protein [Beijerinckiaceae bacterium]
MALKLAGAIASIAVVGAISTAHGQSTPVADFYKRTNISVIVGSGTGGGYDAYARLLARHMGRFVPGSPTMVVQNMPGAGGLKSANNLYMIAPKDGSTIAILHNTLTLNQIAGSASVSYDMRKFAWLGSMSITSTICAFTEKAAVRQLADLVSREVVIGASAGSTSMIPAILNSLVGTKFKQVKGYESTSNILVAMERGEVDGVCGWGWDSAKVQAMSALERKAFGIGLDIANAPHPDLRKIGVPFVMDLMKDGPNKQALDLILSTQYYNRPFAAPPGTPADRVAALRKAFADALKDKALLEDAAKARMDIDYLTPEQIVAALDKAFAVPPDVQKRAIEELKLTGWGGL